AVRVDHIGSTAVPGLPAKDVIDLQVVVPSLDVLDDPAVAGRLATVGFAAPADGWDHARGAGVPDGRWPKRLWGGADPARVVHVHGRPADGAAWRLALLLRDWLRADEDARREYVDLKTALVASGLTTSDYAEAKEPWFARAVPRAEEWGGRTGWQPGPPG